jgi:PAS domain S-box-containing protein
VREGVNRVIGPTLQDSLDVLHGSVHLGVVTANLDRVIDANDAFLRMIQFTREELELGLIDWRAMTPPDSFAKDQIALQQLREYGASVPFEKEYILRDGTHLPMLMGGIRLKQEPLEWMCYVVNLTDRKRAEDAERESRLLQARRVLVNEVAHQLNNPLEALVLLLHALAMRPELVGSDEIQKLLTDADAMTDRITALTKAVLAAGKKP